MGASLLFQKKKKKKENPTQTFFLQKFHNVLFYTACSAINAKSIDGMPLWSTLLKNDLFPQLSC